MKSFQVANGVKVVLASNGVVLSLSADSDPGYTVVKMLTITQSLCLAQCLIQSAMTELGPVGGVFELKLLEKP